MRTLIIAVLWTSGMCAAQSQPAPRPPDPTDPIRATSDHAPMDPTYLIRGRADRASKKECAKVCLEAAAQIAEASDQQFTAGNVVIGQQWIKDAVAYAQKATAASLETHKNQKKAEIELRKLSKRMHDIGDTLAIEDRQPVYDASKTVDGLRDQMLTALFGTPKKSLEEKTK